MNNVRKYLADAQNRAHEGFLNADGFFDDDLNFTAGDDFMNANGNDAMPAAAPTSQPYIIQISNTGYAVANFSVLGSYEQLGDTAAFTSGNYVSGNVTISSAIPNVTYQQMLYQFMNNPFSTGLTYIQSSSNTQLLETISVQTKDANGNVAQKPLVPTIDPYQFQTTVLALRFGYRIDGYTKLILNSILASTTVKLYLYPADNINLARGLSGRAVSKDFSSPGIVRAQTVKIQG
jgi:hypothetical protein